MNKKIFLLTCVMCLTHIANAAEENNYYFSFGTGFYNKVKSFTGFKNTFDCDAEKSSMKDTMPIDIAVGKKINDNFEIELAYKKISNLGFGYDRTFTNPNDDVVTETKGNFKAKADVMSFNMSYYLNSFNNFSPFIGVGMGLTRYNTNLIENYSDAKVLTKQMRPSHVGVNVNYNMSLGALYKFNDRISFSAGYNFISLGAMNTTNKTINYNKDNQVIAIAYEEPMRVDMFAHGPFVKFKVSF